MEYIKISSDEGRTAYNRKHFNIRKVLIPSELLTFTELSRSYLPRYKYDYMLNYVANCLGEVIDISKRNTYKLNGHRFLYDYVCPHFKSKLCPTCGLNESYCVHCPSETFICTDCIWYEDCEDEFLFTH